MSTLLWTVSFLVIISGFWVFSALAFVGQGLQYLLLRVGIYCIFCVDSIFIGHDHKILLRAPNSE